MIPRLLFCWFLSLTSGIVVANNLAVLLAPLAPYDAAWWKVLFAPAVSLAICLWVFAKRGTP